MDPFLVWLCIAIPILIIKSVWINEFRKGVLEAIPHPYQEFDVSYKIEKSHYFQNWNQSKATIIITENGIYIFTFYRPFWLFKMYYNYFALHVQSGDYLPIFDELINKDVRRFVIEHIEFNEETVKFHFKRERKEWGAYLKSKVTLYSMNAEQRHTFLPFYKRWQQHELRPE